MATVNYTPPPLPEEYRGQLSEADQQRKMAELLMAQSSQRRPPGQKIGRFYLPDSPLNTLADVIGRYKAQQQMSGAASKQSEILRGAEMDKLVERQDLLSMTQPQFGAGEEGPQRTEPDFQGLERRGAGARFPENRSMVDALMKRRMELFTAGSKAGTPESIVAGVQGGGNPDLLRPELPDTWSPPKLIPGAPDPRNPNRQVLASTNSRTNKTDILDAPRGAVAEVRVDNRMDGGKGEAAGLDYSIDTIKKTEPLARGYAKALRSSQEALAAIDQGVKTGQTQGVQNWVRGVLSDLGIDAAKPEAMEALASRLNSLVIERAGGLGRQISDADRSFLANATGSILQDPIAIKRALSLMAAIDMQAVEQHNNTVRGAMAATPSAAGHLQSALVPMSFRPGKSDDMVLAVLRGGSTFDVQPAGKQVNAQDLVRSPPSKPKADAGAPLSPAEEQRRQDLRKRLGVK